ncbi:MAG: hypothetical protein ACR2L1_06910 [Pyrinomonadaceae bacterium]
MKIISFAFFLLVFSAVGVFAQDSGTKATDETAASFHSDGCSKFPDYDYTDCCVEHDKTYFSGGSWTRRWRADKKLYKCVAAKKGFEHKLIAPVMWAGVRVFGVPFLPTSFRWGFGKKKVKNSQPTKNKILLKNPPPQ